MGNSADDLWGLMTFPRDGGDSLLGFLRQQAGYLEGKTGGAVIADVESSGLPDGTILHSFNLVVPGLRGFAYTLFRVNASLEGFPVQVGWGDEWTESADFGALVEQVGTILRDPSTARKVYELIEMVQGTGT